MFDSGDKYVVKIDFCCYYSKTFWKCIRQVNIGLLRCSNTILKGEMQFFFLHNSVLVIPRGTQLLKKKY